MIGWGTVGCVILGLMKYQRVHCGGTGLAVCLFCFVVFLFCCSGMCVVDGVLLCDLGSSS